MPVPVADRGSNKIENIEHAVEVIGRSKVRRAIFRAIYTGQRQVKTAKDLAKATGFTHKHGQRTAKEPRR